MSEFYVIDFPPYRPKWNCECAAHSFARLLIATIGDDAIDWKVVDRLHREIAIERYATSSATPSLPS
jgi:hypothetical protein